MLCIYFVNDGTGDVKTGNYDFKVFVNRKLIDEGRVEGHDRDLGWTALVGQVVDGKEATTK